MCRLRLLTFIIILAAGFGCARLPLVGPEPVTFADLLDEMVDLDRLADAPEPAYITRQASSYDRRSTDPTVMDEENWMANLDRGQFVRVEEVDGEKEYVLMDVAGPGAIVRFWSANPGDAANIRIYLDHSDEPVMEMALAEMLSGNDALFPQPIAGVRSRGWNSHLPIPYGRHCKVTSTKPDFYYQINYRTYEAGTWVETWSPEIAREHEAKIQEVAAILDNPVDHIRPLLEPGVTRVEKRHTLTLAPREAQFIEYNGEEQAIYRLLCQVEAEDLEAALRGILLKMTFDGQTSASVLCPLGDFFGTAPGATPYRSLPMSVLEDGTLVSNWVMPFQQSFRLEAANFSGAPATVDWVVLTGSREWSRRTMYFNAGWTAAHEIASFPRRDWNYVEIEGGGRYVGNMMHVSNPVAGWWGEGDEKIYIDGEDFPSIFGTGTEDYYGYAWCHFEPFTHAYHNQVRCDGEPYQNNYGHTCVNRFHVIDDLPFEESLKFDMEIWHWIETPMSVSATSWWYEQPGGSDNLGWPEEAELVVPSVPEVPNVKGALEAEGFVVISGEGVDTQRGGPWQASGWANVWWKAAGVGEEITLSFDVPDAGAYQVIGGFMKAPDYAVVEVMINGETAEENLDLYAPEVVIEEIPLGRFELKGEGNLLRIATRGKNEESAAYYAGIDYLLLKPSP